MTNIKIIEKKLQLYRTENVGPVTYHTLVNKYGLDGALIKIEQMASEGGKKNLKIPKLEDVQMEIFRTEELKGEIIESTSSFFPLIDYQEQFPPILTILGKKELLKEDLVTIIGTRMPSLQGIQYTKHICEYLNNQNQIMMSGFAKGIDSVVHENAKLTIGFLPCGIDVIFPPVNTLLYNQLKKIGLLVTDRPLGQSPIVQNFPQRNKYMTLLSKALVITEAKLNSGSIMTGNFGLKYNKTVFAVPGHPLDIRYAGNNYLLKNGALILDRPEIVSEYMKKKICKDNSINQEKKSYLELEDKNIKDIMRKKLLGILSSIPVSIEVISEHTGFSIGEVNYIVIELELANKIERTIDNKISLQYGC